MDEIIYNAISGYYDTLCKTGYVAYKDVYRILLLCFYREWIFNDYRGALSREDYHEIEKALNCLYGTNCLIPYPDYLKMNKLHLGQVTELTQRIKNIEDTPVLKLVTDPNVKPDPNSDIKIVQNKKQ